jgi:hypothetical protein|nr:MAG TPA: Protein of unknown function (DUF551) [Caudoviricetes sp.]
MNEWISVKNKLPTEYRSVLVFSDEVDIRIAHYEHSCGSTEWYEDTTGKRLSVSHWMYFPDRPKGALV